jgi:hypothetical protein
MRFDTGKRGRKLPQAFMVSVVVHATASSRIHQLPLLRTCEFSALTTLSKVLELINSSPTITFGALPHFSQQKVA